jgi:hypothetical protein
MTPIPQVDDEVDYVVSFRRTSEPTRLTPADVFDMTSRERLTRSSRYRRTAVPGAASGGIHRRGTMRSTG